MKTLKKGAALLLILSFALSLFFGCGKGKEIDVRTAKEELLSAGNEKLSESETALSYTVSYVKDGKEYSLGAENKIYISGRGTDGMAFYRENVWNGAEYKESEEYYYSDGKALISGFGEHFLVTTSGEDFLSYTDESSLSLDRAIFEPDHFENCRVTEKKSEKTYVFGSGSDELEEEICDFLGFSELSYVYSVKDAEMRVSVKDGIITEKRITFDLEYYDPQAPDDVMSYSGDFHEKLVKTSGVEVKKAKLGDGVQEIESAEILDLFSGGGYSVLAAMDGLDVSFSKTVSNADSKGAVYTLSDSVRFTLKNENDIFTYGSADDRALKTPSSNEKSSTGVFLDSKGFHVRSTDGTSEDQDPSEYSEADLRLIVSETLLGEMLYDSDIGSLKITDDGEYYVCVYTLSSGIISDYGEYLLSAFADEASYGAFDLSGYSYSIIKNTGTVKIRKADKIIAMQTFDFDCMFAGSLEVSTSLSVKVNGTGEDVKVITVSDFLMGEVTL